MGGESLAGNDSREASPKRGPSIEEGVSSSSYNTECRRITRRLLDPWGHLDVRVFVTDSAVNFATHVGFLLER